MKRGWLALLVVAVAASQDSDVVLRSTTRLVTVDVVVRDKDGKPVRGLTADDFAVLEDGKKQKVAVFQKPEELGRREDGGAIYRRMELPEQLPANILTNFAASGVTPSPVVSVILLDALNTPLDDQVMARKQILKFLEGLKPTDRVGLYLLGSRLKVLHDFTGDAASLLAQLGQFQGNGMANAMTETPFVAFLNGAKVEAIMSNSADADRAFDQIFTQQGIAVEQLRNRIYRTMTALEAIAQHLAPVPGRKNLLWVSAAFPTVVSTDIRMATGSPETFANVTERAARAIANAGVSVYPIDARGVMVDSMYQAKVTSADYSMSRILSLAKNNGSRRGPAGTFGPRDPLVYSGRDETVSHHDVMKDMAKRTGGRPFFSSNDAGRAIREAIGDADGTYLVGYYPTDGNDDGRFRKLQVKVERAGTVVSHREGYFADASKPVRDQRQREAMWDLMAGPVELSAVPMAVQFEPFKDGIKVAMRFDTSALTLREENGKLLGQLQVVLLYQDVTGAGKGGAEQEVPIKLDVANRKALAAGLNYELALPKVVGATRLLVGVRDLPSGRVGTVHLDLNKLGF